jgi:GAF domain-containing protein
MFYKLKNFMLTSYKDLVKECKGLFADEKDFFANASNFCSLIYHNVELLNWVGFYLLSKDELLLGPFQGKPACIRIKMGDGVCGFSAELKETVVVEDVHRFKGHIACDSASRSEIVIPIIKNKKLFGVLDIDSPVVDRFSERDRRGLEQLLRVLVVSSDLSKVWKYYNS